MKRIGHGVRESARANGAGASAPAPPSFAIRSCRFASERDRPAVQRAGVSGVDVHDAQCPSARSGFAGQVEAVRSPDVVARVPSAVLELVDGAVGGDQVDLEVAPVAVGDVDRHRGGGARGARAVERQRRFDGGPVRDRPRGGGGGGAVARLAGVAAAVALAAGVEQQVGAALRVGDLAGYGVAGQPVGHRVGRGARVEREVDGGRAGHVRRGHRGARDGVGVRVGADPGGGDAHAGGEEVHAGPVVGEVGARVSGVGGAHGDRLGGRGGGDVARVLVLVAGGRHEDHARVDGRFDGGVDRRGVPAAEAHVRHRGAGGVVAHPFDAVDDARVGAVAGAVEDADADEGDLLGDAVFGAADGACDVGAVAVAVLGVRVAVDEVVSGADAAGELAVGGADAGVHDVGGDAGAVAEVFVGVVEGQVGLVDAVQAPRG